MPAPQSLTRQQPRRLSAMIKQAVARGNKATSQATVLDNSNGANHNKPRLSKATLCWWIWTRRKPAMQVEASSAKRQAVATPNTRRLHGWQPGRAHENAADEAESHLTKASKAPQRDSGDKSTGSGAGARRQRRHVEPQGDARRGHAPSPRPSEESGKKIKAK